jgi:protein SCO1/2
MIITSVPPQTNVSVANLNSRSGMSTFSFVLGCVLWLLVLGATWKLVVQKSGDKTSPAGDEQPSKSSSGVELPEASTSSVVINFPRRELPEFEFPECMGGVVSRESLLGKRWLASFVFTRCVETCPMITRNVSDLHRRVAESNPDFQFVSFSVDSSYDTAEVLKAYAETFRADHARWKFLTGDENAIHELIRTGFTQYVKPNLGEARKPGFEVAHTNRAVLVNEDGVPVATYLMTDPDHVVKLRRVIEGKEDFPVPGPAVSGGPVIGNVPGLSFSVAPVAGSEATDENVKSESSSHGEAAPESEEATADEKKNSNGSDPGAVATGQKSTDSEAKESASDRNEKIEQKLPVWVSRLPSINAALNSCCTILLVAGLIAIKRQNRILHRNLMVTAFLVSVVFLACYLTYHQALHHFTGERGRAFVGSATATLVYRSILIPHVILAVFVPILAIRVFVHAWRERWPEHRRLAKITFPIWLFVSITGVVIYGMLYHWPK